MKKLKIIFTVLIVLSLSSCKIVQYRDRIHFPMEMKGETFAINLKKNIVYVLFECKEPIRHDVQCGMMVQFDLDEYGYTYLGEVRRFGCDK